jgi:N-acetylglucosamine-6-phosphate deacetylase
MAAAGKPDGRYRLGGLQVAVRDGLAVVAGTGTIAGSTATADGLFRRAVGTSRASGDAALLAAARQTSANPARAFGWADRHLEPGGRADLVVLDPGHAVRGVLQGGAWVVEPAFGR